MAPVTRPTSSRHRGPWAATLAEVRTIGRTERSARKRADVDPRDPDLRNLRARVDGDRQSGSQIRDARGSGPGEARPRTERRDARPAVEAGLQGPKLESSLVARLERVLDGTGTGPRVRDGGLAGVPGNHVDGPVSRNQAILRARQAAWAEYEDRVFGLLLDALEFHTRCEWTWPEGWHWVFYDAWVEACPHCERQKLNGAPTPFSTLPPSRVSLPP